MYVTLNTITRQYTLFKSPTIELNTNWPMHTIQRYFLTLTYFQIAKCGTCYSLLPTQHYQAIVGPGNITLGCWDPSMNTSLHKHSRWWKRRSWSKLSSHYAQGINRVCECKMNVKSTWIPTWHQMNHVSRSLRLFSKTTSWRSAQHKTGRPCHSKRSQPSIYSIISCVKTRTNRVPLK